MELKFGFSFSFLIIVNPPVVYVYVEMFCVFAKNVVELVMDSVCNCSCTLAWLLLSILRNS